MHLKIKIGRRRLEFGRRKKNNDASGFSGEIMLPQTLTAQEYRQNMQFVAGMRARDDSVVPQSCLCFLPYCCNLEAGGIKTIFLMLEALQKNCGTKLYINIYPPLATRDREKDYETAIRKKFPSLRFSLVQPEEVGHVDIAVCTLWITAFELAKFNRCKQKYYLMQDYEALFYPSGSVSALVDETYKFGFYGITNSARLAEIYKNFSSSPVFHYYPGVDKSLYYPPAAKNFSKEQYSLIFYGRPSNQRNCFELISLICRRIKDALKDKIEIISVGEDYQPKDYRLDKIVCNKGRVGSMQKLAELYRRCDIGISFITTPTFSYQHLEYMASGLCLVTNEQPGIADFVKDGENAVVCPMIVSVIAERIIELVNNPAQMEFLSRNAVQTVRQFDWDNCGKSVCGFIGNKKTI